MGCLWDVEEPKERLWLYGSNWLWMFDLGRNFEEEDSSAVDHNNTVVNTEHSNGFTQLTRKRKRNQRQSSEPENLRKGTSGAGSKVPDSELGTGMSRKMQKVVHNEVSEIQQVDLYANQVLNADDEDDEDDEFLDNRERDQPKLSALDRLRSATDAAMHNEPNKMDVEKDGKKDGTPQWWHTYKYRPIMGIVPIGTGNFESGESSGLEVALIERPEWELNLPSRYYGNQEWEKPGL
jgi:U3 small nucleolar RNA-associated protein 4